MIFLCIDHKSDKYYKSKYIEFEGESISEAKRISKQKFPDGYSLYAYSDHFCFDDMEIIEDD